MTGIRDRLLRLRDRIGRRGASLGFFALVDVVHAIAIAYAPLTGSYPFLSTLLPLWAWALPWVVVGMLCALSAPARQDRIAFVAASALSVGWAAVHLAGWVVGEIPRGYLGGVVWGGYAAFIQVIAGWAENPRRR